jgi:hypothetical protein
MNQRLFSAEVLATLLQASSTPLFAETLALASAKRPRQQLILESFDVTKRSKRKNNG